MVRLVSGENPGGKQDLEHLLKEDIQASEETDELICVSLGLGVLERGEATMTVTSQRVPFVTLA